MQIIQLRVAYDEIALIYRNGKLVEALREGVYRRFDWAYRLRSEVKKLRETQIMSDDLDQMARFEALADVARFVDLKDNERALVTVDGRFMGVLQAGLYGFWTALRKVEIEILDARELRFTHRNLAGILKQASAQRALTVYEVEEGCVGALFVEGELREVLSAGTLAFWKDVARLRLQVIDLREQVLDVAGQEIMTQDKVTLRLNAVVTYRVKDVRRLLAQVVDATQTLYREAQLVLRAQVGGRSLDALLADKNSLADDARKALAAKAAEYGVEILALGVRDVILSGDMKLLLNQVVEAQKAAEANAIKRREETAAMRSQMNTAKLMENNAVLMRLRELEVLESIARTTNLSVVLGDGSLSERITKLI